MSTSGPQDSPVWPPASPGPQDRIDTPYAPAPTGTPPVTTPPTTTPVPPSRPQPRHPGRIAAVAAGVLVFGGAGAAMALAGGDRVEQHDLLKHTLSALTITTGGGDVTVRAGGPADTVQVTRKARGPVALPPLSANDFKDNTLVLTCGNACDVDYEIRVPAGVAVSATTASGDVELDGRLGAVTVQTGSGDVDANVATDRLTTRTGSGDTDLRLGNAPTLVAASSGSGDVDIRVPDGESYVIEPQPGSGDKDIDIVSQTGASHAIQVGSGSGDISVSGR